MPKQIPRSPYERLAGYVHLPRLIDKARLYRQGQLVGYNYKTKGFDKHLLAFLNLDADTFEDAVHRLENDSAIAQWVAEHAAKHTLEEIEIWNSQMSERQPETAEKRARFKFFLKETGAGPREDVKTYFDLIELEEGRLAAPRAESVELSKN